MGVNDPGLYSRTPIRGIQLQYLIHSSCPDHDRSADRKCSPTQPSPGPTGNEVLLLFVKDSKRFTYFFRASRKHDSRWSVPILRQTIGFIDEKSVRIDDNPIFSDHGAETLNYEWLEERG